MAPATRLCGTSASAALSAAKAWVPLFSPVAVVVMLVSRTISPGCCANTRLICVRAASAWLLRLPSAMLWDRSVTITATSGRGLCFSLTSKGPASANSRTAKASPRAQAPFARCTKP